MTFGRIARLMAAALVVGVAVAAAGAGWQALRESSQRLSAEEKTIAQLELRVRSLERRPGNERTWAAVAAQVEPSVFTIATDQELGSGWVVHADASGSDLVTNFHVVEPAWDSGVVTVDVNQADLMIHGTIVRVDRNNDLAIVHVTRRLPALETLRRPAAPRDGSDGRRLSFGPWRQPVDRCGFRFSEPGRQRLFAVLGGDQPGQQRRSGHRQRRSRGRSGNRQARRRRG